MKKIYIAIFLITGLLSSCTNNFDEFNTDTKHPSEVPGESLFSNAEKELTDYISNTNVNINIYKLMAQYWTETTYLDECNYDLVTRNIPAGVYSRLYMRVLKDLDESAGLIDAAAAPTDEDKMVKKNKLAIIEMVNVYVYAHLVDIFGAVPYTEALNGDNVYPKYDSGVDIYKDLFKRLDAALSELDGTAESFGKADLYYGGDTEAWIKFGNALKIKLAIVVADDVTDFASISKAAVDSAYDKAFTSNDDDCQLDYLTASPNYNQLYADLIASGRHDFVPANTLLDKMAELNDPRMSAYFADKMAVNFPVDDHNVKVNDTLLVNAPIRFYYNDGTTAYISPDSITVNDSTKIFGIIIAQADTSLAPTYYFGGDYGYSNAYGQHSHIGASINEPTFPGFLLTYSEQCFYLAEAAERGYSVGHTAEYWYDEGIKASFDKWGVSGADAYLLKPDVAYTTAQGTWRQKIGIQSWLANYVRGAVAYNNWRRLDYPILNLPENLSQESSGLTPAEAYKEIPVRFTFPVNEQTRNKAQYDAASEMIGGDKVTTKVFWDKY